MRLKDETRKEREFSALPGSMLACSIFQLKLGLGAGEGFSPQAHRGLLHRSGIITPMRSIPREAQRHHSGPGSVVGGSFCKSVVFISQGHCGALANNPGCTRSVADRRLKYSPAMIHRHWLILSGTAWTQQ